MPELVTAPHRIPVPSGKIIDEYVGPRGHTWGARGSRDVRSLPLQSHTALRVIAPHLLSRSSHKVPLRNAAPHE
jgi:hypothetical protein